MIQNEKTWNQIAQLQHIIAIKYQFVNQFNAMIAVETDQQKAQLQEAKQ
jgi:hypothetical protein